MVRKKDEIEGDIRKIDQSITRINAEIAQLQKDEQGARSGLADAVLSGTEQKHLDVLTGVHGAIENKRLALNAANQKRQSLTAELQDWERDARVSAWVPVREETRQRFDNLDKLIKSMAAEVQDFESLVDGNSSLAEGLNQDVQILWHRLRTLLSSMDSELKKWDQLTLADIHNHFDKMS